MIGKKKVSVVIPTLNEEQNMKILLNKMPEFVDEVIVVDGYSKDRTREVAKSLGARVVLNKKITKGAAIILGTKEAEGDIIISMDADLSMQHKELRLLAEAVNIGYDFCFGSRFICGGGTEDMPLIRRIGNKIFVALVNLLYGSNYSDLCYGYRAYTKKAFESLKLKSTGFGIETEMSIKAAKKKMKVIEVPSFEKPRKFGKPKLKTFKDGFVMLKIIIRELIR